MTEAGEALGAIAGLVFGGFLFLTFGSAVANSMATEPLIDFQLWGVIYILVAIVIAVATAYAAAYSLLN